MREIIITPIFGAWTRDPDADLYYHNGKGPGMTWEQVEALEQVEREDRS